MYLYGNITSNSYDRGFGGVICVGFGQCTAKNVYSGVKIYSPTYASAASIYGWKADSSSSFYGYNCVVDGEIKAWAYLCPFSADSSNTYIYDSISIADIISDYGLRNSCNIYLGATCNTFQDSAFLNKCTMQRNSGTYTNQNLYVVSLNSTRCYEAADLSEVPTTINRNWSTTSGTYIYSLNSLYRATGKVKAELQSGLLFSNARWLEVEGYYPLPNNNPFLTEAAVLAKIR